MLMHALAASCEELRARTGNPPLSGKYNVCCGNSSLFVSLCLVSIPNYSTEIEFEQCGFHPFPRIYPGSKINGGRLAIEKVFHFLAV